MVGSGSRVSPVLTSRFANRRALALRRAEQNRGREKWPPCSHRENMFMSAKETPFGDFQK